jgi:hypothetical protein
MAPNPNILVIFFPRCFGAPQRPTAISSVQRNLMALCAIWFATKTNEIAIVAIVRSRHVA